MRIVRCTLLMTVTFAGFAIAVAPAHAGWGIGIGIGFPVYRPWGYYHPYYYPYPAVYVAPPPVYVTPAPVYAYSPVYQTAAPPLAAPPAADAAQGSSITPAAANTVSQQNNGGLIQQLSHPDEQTRADAAMQLGRLKAMNAIDPLAATLSGDRSPLARDAAARALGLIGSPKALTALKYAAQADTDRDVRHSAQFSIEVIQSGMKR